MSYGGDDGDDDYDYVDDDDDDDDHDDDDDRNNHNNSIAYCVYYSNDFHFPNFWERLKTSCLLALSRVGSISEFLRDAESMFSSKESLMVMMMTMTMTLMMTMIDRKS